MRWCCIVSFVAGWAVLNNIVAHAADEGARDNSCAACLSVKELLHMSCSELESLYKNGSLSDIPDGKLRGTAIVSPGSATNPAMSRASRLMWQGKVFHQTCSTAVNRFFGIRLIKGELSAGESWMDGKPSLILDYRDTSRIYANVRDEIREIAPGLFLGAMYEQSGCGPKFKMFFILETESCCR